MVQEVVSCWACPPTPSGGSVTEGVSRRKSASAVLQQEARGGWRAASNARSPRVTNTPGPENRTNNHDCDPARRNALKSKNGWLSSSVRSWLFLPLICQACLDAPQRPRLLHFFISHKNSLMVRSCTPPILSLRAGRADTMARPCRTTEQRPMACACALAGGVECVWYA